MNRRDFFRSAGGFPNPSAGSERPTHSSVGRRITGDGLPLRGTASTDGPLRTAARSEVVEILGVPFSALSYDAAVERIREMLSSKSSHHVVLANAHTLNLAHADPAYRQVLQRASLVLRDGVGVELAATLAGHRLTHNFVGTDFVPYLLQRLAPLQPRVFLYGAAPGVAVTAGQVLSANGGGVEVVGTEHGYLDSTCVVERVRAAQPDMVLVALGNPLQEQWIATHLSALSARVAIGVGALFDYLAGRVPRAPQWVRQLRGEWVFRLCVEPGRLWRRYVVGNPQFLWRVVTTTVHREEPS